MIELLPHRRRQYHIFKEDGQDVDTTDEQKVVNGTRVREDEPHASEPEALKRMDFAVKVVDGVVDELQSVGCTCWIVVTPTVVDGWFG